jgi:hypothetical protein
VCVCVCVCVLGMGDSGWETMCVGVVLLVALVNAV